MVFIFEKKRIALLLKLFSQVALFVLFPYQGKVVAFFFLPANQAYLELWVGNERHVCFACIVKSKSRSERKQVIQLDQEVQVCGKFLVECELLCMIHLSPLFIYFFGHGLPFLSCFFDMPCGNVAYLLWACIFYTFFWHSLSSMWHTFFGCASFISFCIAHVFDGDFGERGHGAWSFILWICGWKYIAILHCRSIAWLCTCSWSWEYDKFLSRV